MSTITLLTPVVFNVSEVQVFNESPSIFAHEYVINVTDALVTGDFFQQAQYRQFDETNNTYVVDTMTLKATAEIKENHAEMQSGTIAGVASAGILAGNTLTVGQRIVEIMALKIFGSARAKAAIANDTDIEATVWKGALETTFNTDRNTIFEQYVNLDRVQQEANANVDYNDPSQMTPFNFSGLTFVLPVHVSLDSMKDDAGQSLTGAILNGPVYGEVPKKVENGTMSNCPVRLNLHFA